MAWLLKAEPLFGTDPPDEGAARLADYKARHEALRRQVAPDLYEVYRHGKELRGSLERALLACLHFSKSAPAHRGHAAKPGSNSVSHAEASASSGSLQPHVAVSEGGNTAAVSSAIGNVSTFAPPRLLLSFIDETLLQPVSVWLLALEACRERLTCLQRRNHQYHAARTALSRSLLYHPERPPLRADRQKAVLVAQYEAEERLLEQHLLWLAQQADCLQSHIARSIQELTRHSVPYSVQAAAGLLSFPLQLLDTPRVSPAAQEEVLNSFLPRSPSRQQPSRQVSSHSDAAGGDPFAASPPPASATPAVSIASANSAVGESSATGGLGGLLLPAAAAAPAGPVDEATQPNTQGLANVPFHAKGAAEQTGAVEANTECRPVSTLAAGQPSSPGLAAPTTPPATDLRTPHTAPDHMVSHSSMQLVRPTWYAGSNSTAAARSNEVVSPAQDAASLVQRTALMLVDAPATIDATIHTPEAVASTQQAQQVVSFMAEVSGYDSDSGVIAMAAKQSEQYSSSRSGGELHRLSQGRAAWEAQAQPPMAAALCIAQQVVLAANAAAAHGIAQPLLTEASNMQPPLAEASRMQPWAGSAVADAGVVAAAATGALTEALPDGEPKAMQEGIRLPVDPQQAMVQSTTQQGMEGMLPQQMGPAEAMLTMAEYQMEQQADDGRQRAGRLQAELAMNEQLLAREPYLGQAYDTGRQEPSLAAANMHPAVPARVAALRLEGSGSLKCAQGFGSITPAHALMETESSEDGSGWPAGMPHASWPLLKDSSTSSSSSGSIQANVERVSAGLTQEPAQEAVQAVQETGGGITPVLSCPALFSFPQPMPSTAASTPLPAMTMEQVLAAACPSAPAELPSMVPGTSTSAASTPLALSVSGSETDQFGFGASSSQAAVTQMTGSSSRSGSLNRHASLLPSAEPYVPPPALDLEPQSVASLLTALQDTPFLPPELPHPQHSAFEHAVLPFSTTPDDGVAALPTSPRAHTPLPAHRMELEPQVSLTRLSSSHAHHVRRTTHVSRKHSSEMGGASPSASLSTAASALDDVQAALRLVDVDKSTSITVAELEEKLQPTGARDAVDNGLLCNGRPASALELPERPLLGQPTSDFALPPSGQLDAHHLTVDRPVAGAGGSPAVLVSQPNRQEPQQHGSPAGEKSVLPSDVVPSVRASVMPEVRPVTAAAAELTAMVSELLRVAAGPVASAAPWRFARTSITQKPPHSSKAAAAHAGSQAAATVDMGSRVAQMLQHTPPQGQHHGVDGRMRQPHREQEDDNPLAGVFSGLLAAVSRPAGATVDRLQAVPDVTPGVASDVASDGNEQGGGHKQGEAGGHQPVHDDVQAKQAIHGQASHTLANHPISPRLSSHISASIHNGMHGGVVADFAFPIPTRDVDMSSRLAPYATQLPPASHRASSSHDATARLLSCTAHPAAAVSEAVDCVVGLPAGFTDASSAVQSAAADKVVPAAGPAGAAWQSNTGAPITPSETPIVSHCVSVDSSDPSETSSEGLRSPTPNAATLSTGAALSRFGTEAGHIRHTPAVGTPAWHGHATPRVRAHGARVQRQPSFRSVKSDRSSVASVMGVQLDASKAVRRRKKRAHRVYLFKTYRRVMM